MSQVADRGRTNTVSPLTPTRDELVAGAVSVVVPCHYDERYERTCAAVDSVLSQSRTPDQVIVVVDQNKALRSRLLEGLPSSVTIVENEFAPGSGGARNFGASRAWGELLMFVDDDIILRRDCLEQLMYRLTVGLADVAPERVGGVGGHKVPEWEGSEPRWLPPSFYWVVGASYEGLPGGEACVPQVWGDCMLLRTRPFLGSGGFRNGFGKVGRRSSPDDTEFCHRYARQAEVLWVHDPSAICSHYVPQNRCTYRFFTRRCFVEGVGKAEMRRLGSSIARLDSSEAVFLVRVIPDALRRAVKGFLRREPSAIMRIAAITSGVLITGCGYLWGCLANG